MDECNIIHTCEQNCTNSNGSHQCHCNSGYVLNADGRTCDGKLACTHVWKLCVANG